MTEHNDVPILEEVVFPDNDMDEVLSGENTANSIEQLDETVLRTKLSEAIDQQLDSIIETAIFRTLQDSIAILAEEMKDEVKTHIQQELNTIIKDLLKK